MKVLVACEESQAVTTELRKLGHEAFSCDILPCSGGHPEWHLQMDVFEAIALKKWDLLIAHPPCTYLSSSGLHWNKKRPERALQTLDALEFVRKILNCGIPKIALENPVGCIGTQIRPSDQIIQPYNFGDDASKQTCLWLVNLPLLTPTKSIQPRLVCCGETLEEGLGKYGCPNCEGKNIARKRWANQTNSGQNRLSPGPNRAKLRSKTYPGIARAMAEQWAGLST